MNRLFKIAVKTSGVIIFFLTAIFYMQAQDGPARIYMYLNYYQSAEGQYLLCEVKYRPDKDFLQVHGVDIEFQLNTDSSQINLGTVTTGKDGKARLDLDESKISRDESGFAHFESVFSGNETYRKATKELSTKLVNMSLEGETEDSLKMLTVSAKELIGAEEMDISDTDVKIFVKRTSSDLPVAEGSFDAGTFEIEFPSDLPGDPEGNLMVIARIVEHDDYGTVETRQSFDWGKRVAVVAGAQPRALWSSDAPLWIIIAVTLVFIAAWYHYFLSISKLFKIGKL